MNKTNHSLPCTDIFTHWILSLLKGLTAYPCFQRLTIAWANSISLPYISISIVGPAECIRPSLNKSVLSLNYLEQGWMNCHLFTIKLNKLEHVICECTEWTRYFICEQESDDWQWLKEKGGTGSLSTRNATFYECVEMTYGYMQLNKDVTGSNVNPYHPTTEHVMCVSLIKHTQLRLSARWQGLQYLKGNKDTLKAKSKNKLHRDVC